LRANGGGTVDYLSEPSADDRDSALESQSDCQGFEAMMLFEGFLPYSPVVTM
jgi:hypothetical protein